MTLACLHVLGMRWRRMWIATWWREDPDASGTLDGYCRTLGLCLTSCTSAHWALRMERLAPDLQPWSSGGPDASCPKLSSQTSCLLVPWPLGWGARRYSDNWWDSLTHYFTVWVKKSPLTFFPNELGIFNQCFTYMLYIPIYARLQILFNYFQLWRSYTTLSMTTWFS